ncbi:MAG: helix-turn-helix domain-containing protein [Bacteroidales bacterium]|nr:helix-turn-helix domain-containing protein [Bacteroidales bacterium]
MKGVIIKKGLARTGMTQTKLARLLGITPQAVAGILAASDVRTGTVERICEVMNLPVTFFYDNVPVKTEGTAEKDREIQYLRGQVAAYETALTLLRRPPEEVVGEAITAR